MAVPGELIETRPPPFSGCLGLPTSSLSQDLESLCLLGPWWSDESQIISLTSTLSAGNRETVQASTQHNLHLTGALNHGVTPAGAISRQFHRCNLLNSRGWQVL